jgi:hypothetical protein
MRLERKHHFNYMIERDLISKHTCQKKEGEEFVKEEFKCLGKVGFAKKKDYKKIITASKYRIDNINQNEDYIPKENPESHYNWNIKDDKNYVKNLSNFEVNFLPDINKAIKTTNEINNQNV